jgi:threonylcarbamoyladenosine tRNA methylthiotransferase MtaB
MKNKVAFYTAGCKLNYSETSTIGNQFNERGFQIVEPDEKADVFVLNTCSVTEAAERECRQIIRRVVRKNPETYIIVTGCYAQLRPEEISKIDGVDAVLGSNEKFKLFSILENFNKQKLACTHVSYISETNEFGIAHSSEVDSRTRAFLKIQDGCDYNCSFCTIPLARGRSRSLSAERIIERFRFLIDKGYKEIILTGVNVGDYGVNTDSSLLALLSMLAELNGEFRIRISSVEPNLVSEELLKLIAASDKICKHLHIPLQSGSSKILRAMKRRYTAPEYAELIHKAKNLIPSLAIGVDVIVGFPGESEQDFIRTHNFIRDLPIAYLHVFTYSERPDTPALQLPDSVSVIERKRRNNILRNLGEKKRLQFYASMTGSIQQVLFENSSRQGEMQGYTSNYIKIKTELDYSLINSLVEWRITAIENGLGIGEIMSEKMQLT